MNWKHFFALLLMLLSNSANAADMAYTINDEPTVEEAKSTLDYDPMDWTPMSVEAFGNDIHQIWRFPEEEVWNWSLAIAERLELLCDIRPHTWPEPEVYYFGGLAFNR